MPLSDDDLQAAVAELSTRPRHEKVRTLVHKLLTDALGADSTQISYEHRLPEVRGRIDALLGRTVIEIKSDLRKEQTDAEHQLFRYLPEREAATGQRYVGLATDGATFTAYEMRGEVLTELTRTEAKASEPRGLTAWLEGVVAVQDRLPADALNITNELGRLSAAFARTVGLLTTAWSEVANHSESRLKRGLWARHMGDVYGKALDDDELWLQHTYLVIVAKAIAAGAMGFHDLAPGDLLSGRAFRESGVHGAVEDDFFGWVLDAPGGEEIVRRLVAHAARFDLGDIDVDLLKVLYESLIDPKQRHDLGEYYTPDWLARKVVRRTVGRPANDRVLDPSCGSGAFVFHTLRLKREALGKEGVAVAEMAARCCKEVFGFDVHPVAVIFARVTFLIGLGAALQTRNGEISVPVYLGDALQTKVRRDALEQDLIVEVPPDGKDGKTGAPMLRFPLTLCADPDRFDALLELMEQASAGGWREADFAASARRRGVSDGEQATVVQTWLTYDRLRRQGRDHVWGYVARNLSRPVALSDGPRVDVVVGNPPWLSYRYMSADMQAHFKAQSKEAGVWVAGDEAKLVTQTDLSGLFFVRAVELYLRRPKAGEEGGRIAMVLPLAALTRGQFRAFRTGSWTHATVKFEEAWVLDNQEVSPLFRVPTCVLIAQRTHAKASPTPDRVTTFHGRLPYKDAPEEVANRDLIVFDAPAPSPVSFTAASPYRERFNNGATLYPRLLCLVDREPTGRLGANAKAPIVRSEVRDRKGDWATVEPLRGPVEVEFLRPVYLGESIAPFRTLQPSEGVIPEIGGGDILSSAQASTRGFSHLAKWLASAEKLWKLHGSGKTGYSGQLNHIGKLSAQFPISAIRVVFTKSGTLPAACVLRDKRGVIDHKLYWAAVATESEAHYLTAILSSEAARRRIAHMQSRGEQGARDFDKLMFTLPIPRFDAREAVHADLSAAGRRAEDVAAAVGLDPEGSFGKARAAVRLALRDDGIAGRIDALVDDLLGPDPNKAVPLLIPIMKPKERERWFREAEAASRRIVADPREQALLDELEAIQADNDLSLLP